MSNPHLLSQTTLREILYLYLSVMPDVVFVSLIREEEWVQKLVYYTICALMGAETYYPHIELLAFTLVIVARRLRPYFQAYPIIVLTEALLKKILQKLDTSGCLVNWSIEMSEFDSDYLPQSTKKGQVLTNFITEFNEFLDEIKLGTITNPSGFMSNAPFASLEVG